LNAFRAQAAHVGRLENRQVNSAQMKEAVHTKAISGPVTSFVALMTRDVTENNTQRLAAASAADPAAASSAPTTRGISGASKRRSDSSELAQLEAVVAKKQRDAETSDPTEAEVAAIQKHRDFFSGLLDTNTKERQWVDNMSANVQEMLSERSMVVESALQESVVGIHQTGRNIDQMSSNAGEVAERKAAWVQTLTTLQDGIRSKEAAAVQKTAELTSQLAGVMAELQQSKHDIEVCREVEVELAQMEGDVAGSFAAVDAHMRACEASWTVEAQTFSCAETLHTARADVMAVVKKSVGSVTYEQAGRLKEERLGLLKRVFQDDRLAWVEMHKLRTRKLISRAINDKRIADAHKELKSLQAVGATHEETSSITARVATIMDANGQLAEQTRDLEARIASVEAREQKVRQELGREKGDSESLAAASSRFEVPFRAWLCSQDWSAMAGNVEGPHVLRLADVLREGHCVEYPPAAQREILAAALKAQHAKYTGKGNVRACINPADATFLDRRDVAKAINAPRQGDEGSI
jgi:hypothetical protein